MSNSVGRCLDGVVPGLDYTTVDCLERRRLLAFINHFIIRSVESLTTFSKTCDLKLAEISRRIKKLENAVSLLEAKLESVPELTPAFALSPQAPSVVAASSDFKDTEVTHF